MATTDYTQAFLDIPGTTVFDATQSRLGFQLNQFCMSLMKADNRLAFKADEAAYLQKFPMTPAQRDAVLSRDYNGMISLGGNIYFLAKIGATDGFSFQNLASKMTGMAEAAYRDMMIGGGRSAEGNRSRAAQQAAQASPAQTLAIDAGDQNAQILSPPPPLSTTDPQGDHQHG